MSDERPAWRRPGLPRPPAFELRWDLDTSLPFSGAYRVALYLDVDEDVTCEPDTDLVFGGEARPRFGPEPLVFELRLAPEDVAPSFLFLASPAARFITGQTLCVDGGFSVM